MLGSGDGVQGSRSEVVYQFEHVVLHLGSWDFAVFFQELTDWKRQVG